MPDVSVNECTRTFVKSIMAQQYNDRRMDGQKRQKKAISEVSARRVDLIQKMRQMAGQIKCFN